MAQLPPIVMENHLSFMSIHIILPFPLLLFPWKPRKWILHSCFLFPLGCGQMSYCPSQTRFWTPVLIQSLCQAEQSEVLLRETAGRGSHSPGTHSAIRWEECGWWGWWVQLRKLHALGSWSRESPLLKTLSGEGPVIIILRKCEKAEKTREEREFTGSQVTWCCNALQQALKEGDEKTTSTLRKRARPLRHLSHLDTDIPPSPVGLKISVNEHKGLA